MSDLERQASTWVPPWQRPASPPPAEDLSRADRDADQDDDAARTGTRPAGASDLAAAVAARLAKSLPQIDDAGDAVDDDAVDDDALDEPENVDTVSPARIPAARRPSNVDAVETVDAAEPEAAQAVDVQADVLAQANGTKKSPKRKAKAAPQGNDGEGAGALAALAVEPLRPLADDEVVPVLEAILMVVDEPVSEITLAQVLDLEAEQLAGVLIELSARYSAEGRGFDLRRAAGGWRFYTRAEYASYVERFVLDGQQLRLTQASLETLAVVAYKQPVTRSRVSAIRGVNCDGVIRTLVTRGMIEECGTEPESGAHLYRTTTLFLEKMGLDSVEELPPLAPFLPDNLEELAGTES
jgi:segregation and condensation protein B